MQEVLRSTGMRSWVECFSTFCDFRKVTYSTDFQEFNSKKSANFESTLQSFHFQKTQGPQKLKIADFWVTVKKMSEVLRQDKKKLVFGFFNNLQQHRKCTFFSKSLHPTAQQPGARALRAFLYSEMRVWGPAEASRPRTA